jgi:hypothetical protein
MTQAQEPQSQIDLTRRTRGWRLAIGAAVLGSASTAAGYFVEGDGRVMLVGVGVLFAVAAVYCFLEFLVLTRANTPLDGEAPSFTPLPQSPVTLVRDPRSPPDTTPEASRDK